MFEIFGERQPPANPARESEKAHAGCFRKFQISLARIQCFVVGSQVKARARASRAPAVRGSPCPTIRRSKDRVSSSSILRRAAARSEKAAQRSMRLRATQS